MAAAGDHRAAGRTGIVVAVIAAATIVGVANKAGNLADTSAAGGGAGAAAKAGGGEAVGARKAGGGAPATPRNAHLAGGTHPKTGVPFDADGYPDFRAAGLVEKEFKITYTGSRRGDFREANRKAKLKRTPDDMTWHHHQDGTTMQLVPKDVHRGTGHTGGFSLGKD